MAGELALHGGSRVRNTPFPSWPVYGEAEEKALLDVLHSGKWGRLDGSQVAAFEQEFATYQGAQYGIAVVNGSVALWVALMAAGIQAGDEVIVPPYTFQATAVSVIEANAVPVFVDVHPDSYCLDPDLIEDAITERTRAIIPVHFAGQAADMDAILAIARKYELVVIEDAAHAHGARYKDQGLGAIGDMGAFSFQSSKNLTSGEGGIVLTNSDLYERLVRSVHNCGRLPEGEWYSHYIMGSNFRMTEFQGALLRAQMTRLEEQTRIRDANGLYLNAKLAEIPGILPFPRGQGETRHSYHLYMFRYNAAEFDGVPRERFLEALRAEGVPCSPGYGLPLYRQPLFEQLAFGPFTGYRQTVPNLDYSKVSCPVTERACREEAVWLTQPMLLGTQADMDDIVEAVAKVYAHRQELM
ncbi:MAG: DegT/DnrJ/EryC1/StrS family aminotransferase [Chloroflexi bacterium]|jgi:dTDP-4-amino-4,6-dideoxygalactose transaminase|nr:DegT/DnrJ/EryC1/StrS family aminotransferase [Chloroflexota bacterium]